MTMNNASPTGAFTPPNLVKVQSNIYSMRDDDIDIDDIGDGDLPDILYDYTMFRGLLRTPMDSDDMDPPLRGRTMNAKHPGETG